jgi:hypothetical protein
VETRGPQDDEAGREAQAESNVIRLPRDWLGPREELVPFGTSPDLGASDFWGEGSAAVQRAMEAPAADRHAARARRRRAAGAIAGFHRRVSIGAGRVHTEMQGKARVPHLSIRAVAVSALVVCLVALGMVLGLGRSSRPPAGGGFAFKAGGMAVVLPPLLTDRGNSAVKYERLSRVRRHSTVNRAHRARPRRTSSPAATATVRSSPQTQSAPPSTSASAAVPETTATVPETSATVTTTESTGTPSQETATTATASHDRAPAGPAGPGAPFGPGHLG